MAKRIKTHKLKTDPKHYEKIIQGLKTAELRYNDRDFIVGDVLILEEYDRETKKYTGRYAYVEVSHVLNDDQYLQKGYAMLSFLYIAAKRGDK